MLDKAFKAVFYIFLIVSSIMTLFAVSLFYTDLQNRGRIGSYSYETIITDLNPDKVIEKRWTANWPRDSEWVTYNEFKNMFEKSENQTIIHIPDSVCFQYSSDGKNYRYSIRIVRRRGVFFSEYDWENPITGDTITIGRILFTRE